MQIKSLDSLLGATISKQAVNSLTKAGDNYGSTIVALDVTVDKSRQLQLVAKLYPNNPIIVKLFDSENTFRTELNFYATVIKTLQEFQRRRGLNSLEIFPEFFGGRISLEEGSEVVDKDAVIVLENLKMKGFVVGDRLVGFDYRTTDFILRKLAIFHATPIALKLREPETFEENIRKKIIKASLFADGSPSVMFKPIVDSLQTEHKDLWDIVMKHIDIKYSIFGTNEQREPFATIGHNDFWTNNMMLASTIDRQLLLRIFDFQTCDYGSPVRDLLFFLFSSVRVDVVTQHFKRFLDVYKATFLSTLRSLGCDTKQFEGEAFENELRAEAPCQMLHVILMMIPIFTKPELAISNEKFEEEMPPFDLNQLDGRYLPRIAQMVREFHGRGWI